MTKRSLGQVAPIQRHGNDDERKREKWNQHKEREYREVNILVERMKFQIDSAADISIVEDGFIRHHELEERMCQTTVSMKGVGGESLNVLEEVEVMVQYKEETHNVTFVVVANAEDLISGRAAGRLGFSHLINPK